MYHWWIEVFADNDIIFGMDNKWMFEIIESILKKIMGITVAKDPDDSVDELL